MQRRILEFGFPVSAMAPEIDVLLIIANWYGAIRRRRLDTFAAKRLIGPN
jgi:hypothetical protein